MYTRLIIAVTDRHWVWEQSSQVHWPFNVWCRMCDDLTSGLYCYPGYLTGRRYASHFLEGSIGNLPLHLSFVRYTDMSCGQDCASQHTLHAAKVVRNALLLQEWPGTGGPYVSPLLLISPFKAIAKMLCTQLSQKGLRA